jgi:hypothetical protein
MTKLRHWLANHKFLAHGIAFLLMVFTPIPMFFAAEHSSNLWILLLLAFFVAGNFLVLATK